MFKKRKRRKKLFFQKQKKSFNPIKKYNRKRVDYYKKSLENPFFRSKNKRGRNSFPWKIIGYGLIVFLFISVLTWFFAYSSIWTIESIKITGVSRIPENEVKSLTLEQSRQESFFVFSQRNLIFFKQDDLKNTLNDKFRLDKLKINKNWPDELILELKEIPYAYVLKKENTYQFSDATGFVIDKKDNFNKASSTYPLIESQANTADNKEKIDYILKIDTILEERKKDFEVNKYIIDDKYKTVILQTTSGPQIYFNIEKSPEEQIKKLKVIKKEKLKNDFNSVDYIDLKYEDMIIYR